jgi:hypothetical protein
MYNEMLPFLNASILLTAARKLDLPTVQGEKKSGKPRYTWQRKM